LHQHLDALISTSTDETIVAEYRQDLGAAAAVGGAATQTIRSRFATKASMAGKEGSNRPFRRENSMKIGHHLACMNW
jgi:hypothetical protein